MNFIQVTKGTINVHKSNIELFFNSLATKDKNYFYPHPLNLDGFYSEIKNKTKDFYVFGTEDQIFKVYGMLRGWDEGYEIPSLGIITNSNYQGHGNGLKMMYFLHEQAKEKGASKIRLTVLKENFKAISLYKKLGYTFSELNDKSFLGILNL